MLLRCFLAVETTPSGNVALVHAAEMFAAANRGLMFGDQERALGKIEYLAVLNPPGRLRIEQLTAMAARARLVPKNATGIGGMP